MPLGSVDSESKKTKTETVTFRFPSSLIDELRMDAELQGISLNNYAAKIFSNHIQWERYFLREVLSQLTDEQIVNLAQRLEKQKFTNILAFMKNSHEVDDFVEVIRAWLTVSWMQQNIEVRDGKYYFKIQHSLGSKWSLYVKTLLSELSYDILGRKADISIVGDTLSFVFTK